MAEKEEVWFRLGLFFFFTSNLCTMALSVLPLGVLSECCPETALCWMKQ